MPAHTFINRALVRRGAREVQASTVRQLGQTSWGQAWLGALHAVDAENRLGRGLELARQGAVTSLTLLEPGQVRAEVLGSQPEPYEVQLSLKPMTDQHERHLLAAVAKRPSWLDHLLNSQLPDGIAAVLAEVGFQLFPKSWRDVGMHCTCPDAVVPCKHLAAVLYRLAQYIEEEPFLLFSLRGFELADALQAFEDLSGYQPTALSDLQGLERAGDSTLPPEGENESTSVPMPQVSLPSLLEQWRQLLPARPHWFAGGDLGVLYQQYLAGAAAFWQSRSQEETDAEQPVVAAFGAPPIHAWQVQDFSVTLDAGGGFCYAELLGTNRETVHRFDKEVALLAYAEQGGAGLEPLSAVYRVARALVTQSAVVPHVLHLDTDRYRVRWEAAEQHPEVAAVIKQLGATLGSSVRLRYWHPGEAEETEADYRARLGREIAAELDGSSAEQIPSTSAFRFPVTSDAVHALLAVFLRPMLLAGVEQVFAKAEYPTVQLLFFGRPVALGRADKRRVALGLHVWLQRLRLHANQVRLAVHVEEVPEQPGHFDLQLLALDERAAAPTPVPLSAFGIGGLDSFAGDQLPILRDVALLAEAYEPFACYLDSSPQQSTALRLYGGDFAAFLHEILPALRLVGAQVLLPTGLQQVIRPKLSAILVAREAGAQDADVQKASGKAKGLLGLNALVAFDWQVAVGARYLSAEEFAALADQYEGIVRLRDGFIWLDPAHAERLLKRLASPPRPAPQVVVQSLLTESFQGAPIQLSEELRRLRTDLLTAVATDVQLDGLKATLRPYQDVGVRWLLRNAASGFGSLLADDMGLGKTLQTIALLEHYRNVGHWHTSPALLVLPTSLITNWRRELQRFAPQLRVAIFHGADRSLAQLEGAEVVLTSYGVVRSAILQLAPMPWGAIILDEAQQIKNPSAKQTEAVKQLDAPIRIALSGTPVENRLSEYWSVLDFANPGYLGPLAQFQATYADPIEQDKDPAQLARFRQVTAPFMLRRLKTDRSVIKDLPEKITQLEPVLLTNEQAGLYQQVVDTQLRELAAAEPHERKGRMLSFMTAVKQVCNHPHQYLKRGSRAADASGKALRLLELIQVALERQERVLVFTQYRQMGDLLVDILSKELDFEPPFLHGGCSRAERDQMVFGLQAGGGPPVLLLSIKAGGTGLNLTAANHVIHYDLWWNPAVESQATDRAFRIGQRRNVHVHRLVCAGTFEERIDTMLTQKRALADLTVSEGGAWLGDLAEELLSSLT